MRKPTYKRDQIENCPPEFWIPLEDSIRLQRLMQTCGYVKVLRATAALMKSNGDSAWARLLFGLSNRINNETSLED